MRVNVEALKLWLASNMDFPGISGPALEELMKTVSDFPVMPDEFQMIQRLPDHITNIPELRAYLTGLREQMAVHTDKEAMRNSEFAKLGNLKQFKVYTTCVFAVHAWASNLGLVIVTPTVAQACDQAWEHAKLNKPAGLSVGGGKMWDNYFHDSNSKVKNALRQVIKLACNTAAMPSYPPFTDDELVARSQAGLAPSDVFDTTAAAPRVAGTALTIGDIMQHLKSIDPRISTDPGKAARAKFGVHYKLQSGDKVPFQVPPHADVPTAEQAAYNAELERIRDILDRKYEDDHYPISNLPKKTEP
jgi:hypothetical protein